MTEPDKERMLYNIQVGLWRMEVSKLEEPYKSQILSVWDTLKKRADRAMVALPKIDRAPSETGKPFLVWHKNGFHIAIYFFDKLYIFYRKNGLSSGEEVDIIPDSFADMIIDWKPVKEN